MLDILLIKNEIFHVIIEKDENGMFIGSVPALRSCHTQAKTLPELYKRLDEVVALCLNVD
jgi:predicted RNase H-like HicB family nuclease